MTWRSQLFRLCDSFAAVCGAMADYWRPTRTVLHTLTRTSTTTYSSSTQSSSFNKCGSTAQSSNSHVSSHGSCSTILWTRPPAGSTSLLTITSPSFIVPNLSPMTRLRLETALPLWCSNDWDTCWPNHATFARLSALCVQRGSVSKNTLTLIQHYSLLSMSCSTHPKLSSSAAPGRK